MTSAKECYEFMIVMRPSGPFIRGGCTGDAIFIGGQSPRAFLNGLILTALGFSIRSIGLSIH